MKNKNKNTHICPQCKCSFSDFKSKVRVFCSRECMHKGLSVSLTKRFLDKLIIRKNGCWGWKSPVKSTTGYGQIYLGKGKMASAHRVSYEYFVGKIPEGLVIDHLCRNRACVNPKHLEPVTQRENNLRGEGFAGRNRRKAFCVHGHPFSAENLELLVGSRGLVERRCKICVRSRSSAYQRNRRNKILLGVIK